MENTFELSREQLVERREEMQSWSNLVLAQRWAESSWIAGNLYDWAKYKLEDRDCYTTHMAFVEDCLQEMETRDFIEGAPLQ